MEILNGRLVERRPVIARKQVRARYKTVLTKAEYKEMSETITFIGECVGFTLVLGMIVGCMYVLASMGF